MPNTGSRVMVMQISFQRVNTQEDMEAAWSIRYQVFVEEQGVPVSLERDEWDDRAYHLLARVDCLPVGTGRMLVDGKVGRLGRMAVLPQWRGRGIGGKLLNAFIEWAKELGLSRIKLHAQLHASGFYEKHGFSRKGEVFEEAGIPHIKMYLSLPQTPIVSSGGEDEI